MIKKVFNLEETLQGKVEEDFKELLKDKVLNTDLLEDTFINYFDTYNLEFLEKSIDVKFLDIEDKEKATFIRTFSFTDNFGISSLYFGVEFFVDTDNYDSFKVEEINVEIEFI